MTDSGRVALLTVLILSAALNARTQQFPMDFEKILLPIVVQEPVAGAHGSLWITRVAITNTGSDSVAIAGYEFIEGGCRILCPPQPPTPPGIMFLPRLLIFTSEVQGFFLYVERGHIDDVAVQLRVQDPSRQSQTWGTEIPTVREKEF